jgi:DNA-binding CsgD family transcriptional regulator
MTRLDDELLELGGNISEALEHVPIPATLLDREGTIRWQNAASIRARGNRVGCDFAELVCPNEQPEARDLIRRILCHGEPAELTVQVLDATHTYVPIQLSAVPVKAGNSVVAVFGLGQTVAARPPARDARASSPVLTARQHEVLRLLAEGRSTDEIAHALTLSPTTVRNHVAALLTVLGVHSRLQAVLKATQSGMLDL